jgi:hypothetical protein
MGGYLLGGLTLLVIGLIAVGGALAMIDFIKAGRTCKTHGCGHRQMGNDDRCAICREPLD